MPNVMWLRASLISKVLVYALLGLAAIVTLLPFLWAFINSIKTSTATFAPGTFIPFIDFQPTLDSWRNVFSDPQTINALINSSIVSVGTTILVLVLGVPAAYALARFEFPIRSGDIAVWFLSQRVLPPAVVLAPFYLFMVYLGLIDTRAGLIFCYSTFNLAFAVLIMRDMFRDISTDIEDAARIEGASPWQVFWKISLPLSVHGLVVTALLVFAFAWNEALFASALTSQNATTFSALLLASRSIRGVDFNTAAVNTLIGVVPPAIFYLFVQRYLARGLSFGAVKG